MIFFRVLVRVLRRAIYKVRYLYSFEVLRAKNPSCKFYDGARIHETEFDAYNVIYEDVTIAFSKLGKHTYIQKRSTIFNAHIGKFCSIAAGVSIGPGIHKTDFVSTHNAFYLYNTPLIKKFSKRDAFSSFSTVKIGHDVWIGERAIILDGLSIGNGSIIAAGAVVTKDVEPYSIVGGVPAKLIRKRFDNKTIEALLNLKWWDKPDDWLEKNYKLFLSTHDLLEYKNDHGVEHISNIN